MVRERGRRDRDGERAARLLDVLAKGANDGQPRGIRERVEHRVEGQVRCLGMDQGRPSWMPGRTKRTPLVGGEAIGLRAKTIASLGRTIDD